MRSCRVDSCNIILHYALYIVYAFIRNHLEKLSEIQNIIFNFIVWNQLMELVLIDIYQMGQNFD